MTWPSFRYGPDGASMICQSEEDVPPGWEDHPSKVKQAPVEPSDDLKSLRAEYTEKMGKRPYNGWDAAKLREKMHDAGV